MKTLEQIVIDRKIRKGKAFGITKDGAFWRFCSIRISDLGGDGIGNSSASQYINFIIDHYRSGEIKVKIKNYFYHQNRGRFDESVIILQKEVLQIDNLEDLIVIIRKNIDSTLNNISELETIGLSNLPSPDDE